MTSESRESSWLQPVRDRLFNRNNNGGNGDGENLPAEMDQSYPDGFMPDLPSNSGYGPLKPPISEKLIDAMINTEKIDSDKEKELWIFTTTFLRHFQLSNFTGADVQEILDRIRDIQMVYRWGARQKAHDMQIELVINVLSRKSRGDLKDGLRERPMWGGIMNIGKYIFGNEVKPPRDTGSWSSMFTGGRNQRRY